MEEQELRLQFRFGKLRKKMQQLESTGSGEDQKALAAAIEEIGVAIQELSIRNRELIVARELVERERMHFQELFNLVPDGYVYTDANALVIEASGTACAMLGVPGEFLKKRPLSLFISSDERKAFLQLTRDLSGSEFIKRVTLMVAPRRRKSFPAEVTAVGSRDEKGGLTGFRFLIHDITRRKKYEQDLERRTRELEKANLLLGAEISAREKAQADVERLSRRVIQEDERARSKIAADLHDVLGQNLQYLKLELGNLCDREVEGSAAARCDQVERMIEESISIVRGLVAELMPAGLEMFGLEKAVENYVDHFARDSGIETTFESSVDHEAFDRETELSVFRVVQESLANVQKHSGSAIAAVRLDEADGDLSLVVRDEGTGFDVDGALADSARGTHFGLLSIMERAKMLGGELTIGSSEEGGTVVRMKVPIKRGFRGD